MKNREAVKINNLALPTTYEVSPKISENPPKIQLNHRPTGERHRQHLPYSKRRKNPRKKSLVIFGGDRSGTTFLTNLFSEDLNIFAVYEPLWITRDWSRAETGRNLTKDFTEVISVVNELPFY